MALNDIKLGPASSEVLLSPFAREFTQLRVEVSREDRTASGRLVRADQHVLATSPTTLPSASRAALGFSNEAGAGLPCQPPPWSEGVPQPLMVLAMRAVGAASASLESYQARPPNQS